MTKERSSPRTKAARSNENQATLGRYALYGEIAAGGMATVHLGRLMGSVGFARTVAIKRLHPHLAKDPDFVDMFLEEARLASRVRHPNVVTALDVVSDDTELFIVMEYVAGESLSRLVRKTREAGGRIPPRYIVGIMCAALEGLEAAHDATSERGQPLGIVHRDVSPQNIHVGLDGVARVLDFGIAKATNRVQETRTDQIKGKVAYMSPEQLSKGPIDRRADVYSASVVLWEALTGKRLFKADDVPALVYSIINDDLEPPSAIVPDLPKGFDEIVMRGLDRDAKKRWPTTRDMAIALERVMSPAPAREIGEWVRATAGDALQWRIELVHRIESESSTSIPPPLIRASSDSPQGFEVASGVVDAPPESAADAGELADSYHQRVFEPLIGEQPSLPDDERATLYAPKIIAPAPSSPSNRDIGAEYTDPDAGHRKRNWLIFVAFGLIIVGATAVVFRLIQLRTEEANATATPSADTSAGDTTAITVQSGMRSAKVKPPETPSTVIVAPTSPASAATSVAPVLRPVVPVQPVAPAVPSDCDNPFTIDSKGLRHPKPYCFRK